jgi:hypothetical protein
VVVRSGRWLMPDIWEFADKLSARKDQLLSPCDTGISRFSGYPQTLPH